MKDAYLNSLKTILENANHCLSDIATSIKTLSSDPWVKYGAIANFILALVAVYAANKDYFYGLFFKPKIQIKEPFSLRQGALFACALENKKHQKTCC